MQDVKKWKKGRKVNADKANFLENKDKKKTSYPSTSLPTPAELNHRKPVPLKNLMCQEEDLASCTWCVACQSHKGSRLLLTLFCVYLPTYPLFLSEGSKRPSRDWVVFPNGGTTWSNNNNTVINKCLSGYIPKGKLPQYALTQSMQAGAISRGVINQSPQSWSFITAQTVTILQLPVPVTTQHLGKELFSDWVILCSFIFTSIMVWTFLCSLLMCWRRSLKKKTAGQVISLPISNSTDQKWYCSSSSAWRM